VELLGEPRDGGGGGRSPIALAAIVLAVVAAAGGAYYLLHRPAPAPSPAPPRAPRATPAPAALATPAPAPTVEARAAGATRPRTSPTAAPVARLRVDADVSGASVFLDRKYLGTTPVETTDFTPGSHRLNVSAEGQDMYAESIDVPPEGRDVMVRFKEVRLDEHVDVVHKHGVGSCRGRLAASPAGLKYASGGEDSFEAPFASLEPLQVDYLRKNLRVKLKGGKTWNFTADSADALLVFQKAVEAARKKL
jgi:hypothetical protein